jgi:hypothetical protein
MWWSELFNQFNPEARIWFYCANRKLNVVEKIQVQNESRLFLDKWNTHGKNNQGEVILLGDQILTVVGMQESAQISGCSIDQSVQFIKKMEEKCGLSLFERNLVFHQGKDGVNVSTLAEFWAKRKAGLINENTLVWDTTVHNVGEFQRSFVKRFEESWHQEMWDR